MFPLAPGIFLKGKQCELDFPVYVAWAAGSQETRLGVRLCSLLALKPCPNCLNSGSNRYCNYINYANIPNWFLKLSSLIDSGRALLRQSHFHWKSMWQILVFPGFENKANDYLSPLSRSQWNHLCDLILTWADSTPIFLTQQERKVFGWLLWLGRSYWWDACTLSDGSGNSTADTQSSRSGRDFQPLISVKFVRSQPPHIFCIWWLCQGSHDIFWWSELRLNPDTIMTVWMVSWWAILLPFSYWKGGGGPLLNVV